MGMLPTCKEVHRLTSEGLDRELSLAERTRMRAHLMLCGACHNFTRQMEFLRKAMRSIDTVDRNGKDGG